MHRNDTRSRVSTIVLWWQRRLALACLAVGRCLTAYHDGDPGTPHDGGLLSFSEYPVFDYPSCEYGGTARLTMPSGFGALDVPLLVTNQSGWTSIRQGMAEQFLQVSNNRYAALMACMQS
jgi:hypothetical protein